MTQYQSVIVRLKTRVHDDEELVTDLLNERSRMGWTFHSCTPILSAKLLLVFYRDA